MQSDAVFFGIEGERLLTAIVVTAVFTLLGRWMRGVSRSGAVAGAGLCFLLYAAAGAGAFAALMTVFGLTWITTRIGYARKQKLGMAEKRDGRNAWQVLANLGVAAACAAFYAATRYPILLLAAAAALSEAAADTVSSEVGQASNDKARLITTWQIVPAGTDGGITLAGTLAGMAAAAMVSLVCMLAALIPKGWFVVSMAAGAAGMVADSYLGVWLERKRLLTNDSVNFLSTLIAAGCAVLWSHASA